MAVPDFQTLMLPFLKVASDGQEHMLADVSAKLADEFGLTAEDRKELLPSGRQTRFDNRVGWTATYLKKAGLLDGLGRGRYRLTERGRGLLAENPRTLSVSELETRFRELAEFLQPATSDSEDQRAAVFNVAEGNWTVRPGVQDRIREKIERMIPDEIVRREAMQLLAFVIENADEERGDSWCVRETRHGLLVIAGRQRVCKIARSKAQIGVLGPIGDEVRTALGADAEDDAEVKKIPGGVWLTFSVEHSRRALELCRDAINSFVDLAMARVRNAVSLDNHTPEAVNFVASVVGRELPQPEPTAQSAEADEYQDESEDEAGAADLRKPRVRGRAPIFELGQRSIGSLISDIEREVIALPDLQRPFVWEDARVRDLLDSLFLGFPVGTLVLWHTSTEKDARAMAAERPTLRATTLVIDGQQRLTSLFAVMHGATIIGKDGSKRKITIAFRPRDGRFEVSDAAIRNDPEFIPNVTELWSGVRPKPQIRRDLMNALRDRGRPVDNDYEDAVERNLDRAYTLLDYRFPTVDIRKTAASRDEEASEEDVAEIFVRINNQGMRLGQADFVLTLLSVFHGKLRDRFEVQAQKMSVGAVVAVDTQQLLRAACAVAFGRARMSAVYRYLRGIDPTTGESDVAGRAKRLDLLDAAAGECIDATRWRDYVLRVRHAGFVNQSLVASPNAIVNAYAFYIRGRKSGAPENKLGEMISRWVFGTLLTSRYSGSSETIFEQDLARVAALEPDDGAGFLRVLDEALGETITGDFWTHTLVSLLDTQRGKAPAPLAFRASQVILGTRALFSDQLLHNLLDSTMQGGRSASEAHHLFPKAWLHSRGIGDRRRVNQVANMADVGWHENSVIGARSPADYVRRVRDRLDIDDARWGRLCAEHALPAGWESMDYDMFLAERRRRMAEIIRVAYRKLGGEADAEPLTPPWFLPGAEAVWAEIVETERALRTLVREAYAARFGEGAALKIEETVPQPERESLKRALRARPAGAEPLTIVDYLYLAQLPPLLFAADVWQSARERFGDGKDTKAKLQAAIAKITPVRNEIAHVREVDRDRLLRATVACREILEMLRAGARSDQPGSSSGGPVETDRRAS
jgi:hypothetical protein